MGETFDFLVCVVAMVFMFAFFSWSQQ